jgi:hypothetical protein
MKNNTIDKIKFKIQVFENEAKRNEQEAQRFRDILHAVETLDLEAFPKEPSLLPKLNNESKETFKTSICNILKGGKEMGSQEILKAYNKRTNKEFTLNQFSGRLSLLVGDVIIKRVDEEKQMSERNTYSLKK